ncbi:MAG TPA: agmatinase, partial [Candidatus Marinimicrobia bacterium]|nr:agmatinase [Candidatus Neomarinimicrobiota bacterium]
MPELHDDELHPSYIGMPTYLGTPFAVNTKELKSMNADIAIIGAPVDMGVVGRPGARYGPRAIRQADYWPKPAKSSNLYHLNLEVFPLKKMNVVDFGDANCPPSSLEKSHEAVEKKVTEALDADAIPIVLGGDHSITLPSATAVAKKYGYGNVGMVHFDAHADTRESSYGDVLIGHGSPMRRLIESGAIPGKNFVQIGLRGPWPPPVDQKWMKDQGMRWHLMAEIEKKGFDEVLEMAISEALDGPDKLYISVDVDVMDPAFAPGTGTPEPGGISSLELLRAIREIVLSKGMVAMDVVEVAPIYDQPGDITAQAAHRCIYEAISALAKKKS